ncbi:MAG: acylneuraminate cytidylyltransferase family protein [Crocinitomicaceae bacterium]|nr:acylneuraminate cytidylyltransferase family protein [Crocinitomicaceae bacterium]
MNKKVSIVALIPARSSSKRIKDKNIKLLNGHPLIAYTISAAIDSGVFGDVIVSTDSEKYKVIAEYYGASVFLRPEKFSGDNSPDIEWVTYTLSELMNEEKNFEFFSILRPTSPFRTPQTIIRALNTFLKFNDADSLRAVEICAQHPGKMWQIKDDKMTPIMDGNINGVPWHSCQFSSLPDVYVQNASLEIAKTSVALEKKSISGEKIIPFITAEFEGYDINRTKDWVYAEYLAKKNKHLFLNINMKPYNS